MDLFLEAQLNRHNLELTWVSVIEAQPKPISRYALDSLKNSWAQLLSPKPEIKLQAQRGSGNVSNPKSFSEPNQTQARSSPVRFINPLQVSQQPSSLRHKRWNTDLKERRPNGPNLK